MGLLAFFSLAVLDAAALAVGVLVFFLLAVLDAAALTVGLLVFFSLAVLAAAALTVGLFVVFKRAAFAVGTVLVWLLVAAAPPMGLSLIAIPGSVCVMGGASGPFLKMEAANANGPGPAVTPLVPPKKLNPPFKVPFPALISLPFPPPLMAKFRLLPAPPADSVLSSPTMFLAPL